MKPAAVPRPRARQRGGKNSWGWGRHFAISRFLVEKSRSCVRGLRLFAFDYGLSNAVPIKSSMNLTTQWKISEL